MDDATAGAGVRTAPGSRGLIIPIPVSVIPGLVELLTTPGVLITLPFLNAMPGDGWGHGAHQPCQGVGLGIRDLVSRSEKRERRKAMTGEWGKNSPSSPPYFPKHVYYLRI